MAKSLSRCPICDRQDVPADRWQCDKLSGGRGAGHTQASRRGFVRESAIDRYGVGENQTEAPGSDDNEKADRDAEERMPPSRKHSDDVSKKTSQLSRGCHVATEITAEAGASYVEFGLHFPPPAKNVAADEFASGVIISNMGQFVNG